MGRVMSEMRARLQEGQDRSKAEFYASRRDVGDELLRNTRPFPPALCFLMRPFQVPAHTAPNSYRLDIPCRAPEPLPLPSRPPLRRIGARRRRCLAPTARPSARCGSCASSRCSTAPAGCPAGTAAPGPPCPAADRRPRLRRLLHPHESAGRVYCGRGAARRPWRGTGGPDRICSRGAFSQTRTWWPTRCSRRCAAQWTRCSTPHPTATAGCFSRRHRWMLLSPARCRRGKHPAGAVG